MLLVLCLSLTGFIYLIYIIFENRLRLSQSSKAGPPRKFDHETQLNLPPAGEAMRKGLKESLKPTTPLESDKLLYHFLQNLEQFPTALYTGRNRLLELLDETVSAALETTPDESSILSIPKYSPNALYEFFKNFEARTTTNFESYLSRRHQGGGRELLPNLEYAKWWLRTAAPVKYVDGSWLGGINRAFNTLPHNRISQRIAWQILSEELGDGDLTKNHVWVYQQLMASIGTDIGTGDERGFIDHFQNPNGDERVWKAAVSQLCISLYPEEFLPEILGFNMAYENLPLHLLITIQELRELGLDPYYFILHISIDNGHSGHAAMGVKAVTEYIGSLPPSKIETAWRRVQAGVILAEGLPTIPGAPTKLDRQVETLFGEKCVTARPMHACCPARIGGKSGKSLGQWLDTGTYHTHSLAFLRALTESRWVVRGSPKQSKLIKEFQWGGRMFGAFTSEEVGMLKDWVEGLAYPSQKSPDGAYFRFTGKSFTASPKQLSQDNPSRRISSPNRIPTSVVFSDLLSSTPLPGTITTSRLLSILRLSAVPFEHLPSYPAKCATQQGMAAVKILRALYGFKDQSDLCAGIDEFRHPNESRGIYEISEHPRITQELEGPVLEVSEWLCSISRAPVRNYSFLLGAQLSFVVNIFWNKSLLRAGVLCGKDIERLRVIGGQCMAISKEILELCEWNEVVEGFFRSRSEVGRCIVDASGGGDLEE